MTRLTIIRSIVIGCSVLMLVVAAVAGIATRKTRVTFSHSVRVPGRVLSAGTYYFEAPNFNQRTIVKVSDESHNFVTQFMGLPDITRKKDHDIITFGDHECGPKAVKSWFYPGTGSGVRFVYSKEEAEVIAAACDEPVPEIHEKSPDVAQLMVYKVYLITPQKQEEDYKPEALSTSDQVDQNGFDGSAVESSGGNNDSMPR